MGNVIVHIEKNAVCTQRLTYETEKGTNYAIVLLTDQGEEFTVPGQEAFDAFPIGSGLRFVATLSHREDMDSIEPGIVPK